MVAAGRGLSTQPCSPHLWLWRGPGWHRRPGRAPVPPTSGSTARHVLLRRAPHYCEGGLGRWRPGMACYGCPPGLVQGPHRAGWLWRVTAPQEEYSAWLSLRAARDESVSSLGRAPAGLPWGALSALAWPHCSLLSPQKPASGGHRPTSWGPKATLLYWGYMWARGW